MFDPDAFGTAMGEIVREAIAPLLERIKELEARPMPVDGVGLAGAMIDRDGALVVTLTNGEIKTLGPVVGKDGKDGVSLDSFEMSYMPEAHEVSLKAVCGQRTQETRYPAGGIRPAGYWREGTKAKAGEAWVHDGSTWYAIKDCASTPSTKDDNWIIGARKGRDGERGQRGADNAVIQPIALRN